MNWSEFTSSSVIAAAAGVLGGLIGVAISSWNTRSIHREKIAAEIDLAERRFTLDKAVIAWRRRHELAEQVLVAVYEARRALIWARATVILSGEGKTRQTTEVESDRLRERRNSYFVPLERLSRDAKSFATLETLRYAMSAHFGQEVIGPIGAFAEAYNEIATAAGYLIDLASADDDPTARQSLAPLREVLYGRRPDAIDKKIDDAVLSIEAICRPVLSEKLPT